MDQRDVFLKEFRGETIGIVTPQSSADELFQNEVLRPILKLQNDLFIASFINYLGKNRIHFDTFSVEKKLTAIENAIQKDIKFRNALKGMIIALFTIDEYAQYIKNSSSLNKRMMGMLIERLKSQVQLFEVQGI
ncbi:glyoxalase [Flavobacterium alvei]|uniref:Glyoxalase n=1 Tax=Flavobacterium alvei TaxID=2080416 RepID=A0A2S5A9W8_9FLAO|nr:glyoxalase [Flavobacterium alvei]POY38913.1 glyoxalase [Flavobacterium alvei]HQE35228.1 glyoxalase [Flavobacterium alvei]HQK40794.1 glyoxalase [Flavobacterium alvei]